VSAALDELLALFESDRATAMYDEVVTEREHALQTALLAEEAGADDATVAAALLHDVGRLLIDADPGFVAADRAHDKVGERYLRQWFGAAVTAPVGLHVAAKRYLCATESDYLDRLSPVSVRSLEVQGGPMSEAEVEAFRAGIGWEAGVQLRRWDDEAKLEDHRTRAVADYRPLLECLVEG
jgi:predicted HD phosphohydrolase